MQARCKPLDRTARNVCNERARGARDVAVADLDMQYKPTADNDENHQVTVNWAQSEVRTSTVVLGQRIAGSWRTLSNYSTNIAANASVDRAFTLDLPCNIDRQYRLRVSGGGHTWWEYQNEVGPTGSWTRSVSPFIDLER